MAALQLIQFSRLEYSVITSFCYLPSKTFCFIPNPSRDPKPQFTSLPNRCSSRPIHTTTSEEHPSFTVTYLITSCGLSQEAAISASRKLRLQSPERPNLVLALLKDKGFSKIQISKIIRKRPVLLLSSPEGILLPKLEFFHSIGFSKPDLAKTIASDPTLLTRSLNKQIIPCYNFLKSVLLTNEKIVASLKRTTWIILDDQSKKLIPNIGFLEEQGVPRKFITLLLTHFPEALMQKHDEFVNIVNEVKKMGFNPEKSVFVLAVHAISGKGNRSIWEKCLEVYSRWGLSKDEIISAFRKHPHCMMLSEKKIMKTMDFFVNQMGLPSRVIAQCPVVLFFSLEKRIIPRCSVTRVLYSKGLMKEELSLTTVLLPVEESFLERFVTKYEEYVPQLLSVYKGKVSPHEV